MYIRPLTDFETNQISEAKREANKNLTKQRQAVAREIKKATYGPLKTELLVKHERLQPITGRPVFVSLDGETMPLDYELLKKLDRSLERRFWSRTMTIKGVPEKLALVIEYATGEIGINQLPDHQMELLKGLPVVRLDGPSPEELREIEELLS
ncbi:MAG: hypothetical protein WC364_10580 [Eubacteriales bacterium]|jgi:hypothetical protein